MLHLSTDSVQFKLKFITKAIREREREMLKVLVFDKPDPHDLLRSAHTKGLVARTCCSDRSTMGLVVGTSPL